MGPRAEKGGYPPPFSFGVVWMRCSAVCMGLAAVEGSSRIALNSKESPHLRYPTLLGFPINVILPRLARKFNDSSVLFD